MLMSFNPLGNRIMSYFSPEVTLDGEPVGGAEPGGLGEPLEEPLPSGEPTEPFHSWTDPDGKKISFADKEALDKHLKEHFSRQSDYTKKTDEISKERDRIRLREQELEMLARNLNQQAQEYSRWQQFMDSKPDVYKRFRQQVLSPASPEDSFERSRQYTDGVVKELKELVQSLVDWKKGKEFDDNKKGIYDELSGELEGFDSNAVETLLEEIQNDPKALIKAIHFSLRGQQDPLQMERKVAEAAKEKQRAGNLVGGRSKQSAPKEMTIDDGREAAMREL